MISTLRISCGFNSAKVCSTLNYVFVIRLSRSSVIDFQDSLLRSTFRGIPLSNDEATAKLAFCASKSQVNVEKTAKHWHAAMLQFETSSRDRFVLAG